MTGVEAPELRVLVDQAELSLAGGNAAESLATADRVLSAVGRRTPPELVRTARRVRALALEATGRVSTAILELIPLVAAPQPDRLWLMEVIALMRCYREVGDYEHAIAVAGEAERPIAALKLGTLTEAIQIVVTLAGVYQARGDLGMARRLCKKAIRTAEGCGSVIGVASAYWNASIIESDDGAHDAALDLGQLALAQFEQGDDLRNLGLLRGNVADLMLCVDPPDVHGALALLDQADKELAWSSASAADVARQQLTRGEAHLKLGDYVTAQQYLGLSLQTAPADVYSLQASIQIANGQLAAAQGHLADATRHYQNAAEILSRIGSSRRAAQQWLELGQLLDELGARDEAHDAYRRAAISRGLGR